MTRVVEGESTSVGAGVAQFLRWRLTHWSDWRSPMLTLMGLAAVCRAPASSYITAGSTSSDVRHSRPWARPPSSLR